MKHIKKIFATERSIGGKMFTIVGVKDTKHNTVSAGMTVLHDDDVPNPVKAVEVATNRAVTCPFFITDYGTMKVKDERVFSYIQDEIMDTFYEVIQDALLSTLKGEGYFGIPKLIKEEPQNVEIAVSDGEKGTDAE